MLWFTYFFPHSFIDSPFYATESATWFRWSVVILLVVILMSASVSWSTIVGKLLRNQLVKSNDPRPIFPADRLSFVYKARNRRLPWGLCLLCRLLYLICSFSYVVHFHFKYLKLIRIITRIYFWLKKNIFDVWVTDFFTNHFFLNLLDGFIHNQPVYSISLMNLHLIDITCYAKRYQSTRIPTVSWSHMSKAINCCQNRVHWVQHSLNRTLSPSHSNAIWQFSCFNRGLRL